MTPEDARKKYDTSASFRKVDKAQADKIFNTFTNLDKVKDMADAIAVAAKFGEQRPISDRSPSSIS